MDKDIKKAMDNIYGFEVVEENGVNKVRTPRMDLPQAVKERIKFFAKYREDGMTFLGCLNIIMAEEDELELKEDFAIGATEDYLPASEEFKQWRDEFGLTNIQAMEIAVALIYGLGDGSDE